VASGKSLTLQDADWITFMQRAEFNRVNPRETRQRDRSLSGKARIRARRAARRGTTTGSRK
jgi:hypothetical protein